MIQRLFVILLIILRVCTLLCVGNKMFVNSLTVVGNFDQEDVRRSASDAGVRSPVELRRSSRIKQPSKRFLFESYRAERANTLFNSRTGYVGTLTKLQGTIQKLMDNGGPCEELKSKQRSQDDVWRKFVSTHVEYVKCLEVLDYKEELAYYSMQRRLWRLG